MRMIFVFIAAAMALLSNVAFAAEETSASSLILAVHPYLPRQEINARFTPLADYLGHALGRKVTIRVGSDYADHIAAIGSDSVDVAYMGPAGYVLLTRDYGAKPLLARQVVQDDPFIKGMIFVRRDSPIASLGELRGKRVLLGDPDSTMTVVPRAMLENAGVPAGALASLDYVTGHRNIVVAVLAGDYDAGAVKDEVFEEYAPKGLRLLAATPPVSDHVFVASAKMPKREVEALRRLFLALNDSEAGKAAMKAIHPGMTALVRPADSDYDSLRAVMNIKIPSR
jgi:phosphonate transport system substrate-binding protein